MVNASDRNSRRGQSSALCLTSWAECPPFCKALLLRRWNGLLVCGCPSLVLCLVSVRKLQRMKIHHLSKQRASSSTSNWEKELQLMKKNTEFFHFQWTHLERTSLLPAAALLVLWNPIWGVWGNSTPVLLDVLSQLQRMSCFGGENHPWVHYFLSCALQNFLL